MFWIILILGIICICEDFRILIRQDGAKLDDGLKSFTYHSSQILITDVIFYLMLGLALLAAKDIGPYSWQAWALYLVFVGGIFAAVGVRTTKIVLNLEQGSLIIRRCCCVKRVLITPDLSIRFRSPGPEEDSGVQLYLYDSEEKPLICLNNFSGIPNLISDLKKYGVSSGEKVFRERSLVVNRISKVFMFLVSSSLISLILIEAWRALR